MRIEWTFAMNRPWTIDRALDFVAMANRFTCSIYVGKSGKMLNAKGLLGVVSFSLTLGDQPTVDLHLDGADADEAFDQLSVYLQGSELLACALYPRSS